MQESCDYTVRAHKGATMNIIFSEKTAKASYKEHRIHIYDVKQHDGKWHCCITITTPVEAPHTDDIRLFRSFDCSSDEETISLAKEFAAQWIEKHRF
jgi:hypothetical protein